LKSPLNYKKSCTGHRYFGTLWINRQEIQKTIQMTENTYNISISMAAGLGVSVREAGDFSIFLSIRRELNHFLLNLNHSHRAESAGQQIHFLFLALENLDRADKEIRIYGADQDVLRMERIHDKIRSLKNLILDYIRYLTSGN
jgi:hypothetical protein